MEADVYVARAKHTYNCVWMWNLLKGRGELGTQSCLLVACW